MKFKLSQLLKKYTVKNSQNYEPVAVGRYGIRKRSDIYKKELSNDYSKNKVIFKDTLIIGMGSVQIDVGVLCDDQNYSVSPAYHTFKINTKIVLSEFLEILFAAKNYFYTQKYMIASARQGKKVDVEGLLQETVDIPDFSEQELVIEKNKRIKKILNDCKNQIALFDELVKSKFNEMFCPFEQQTKCMDEVCSICRGASPRPISAYVTSDDDGVNWIKIGDVGEDDIYITRTSERITKEGAKKSRRVKPGDFILSNSMSFGRPYILGIHGCVHDGWLIISDYEKFLNPIYGDELRVMKTDIRTNLMVRRLDRQCEI